MLELLAVEVPWDDNGEYVFGAYAVFTVLVVVYIAIIAMKIARMERQLSELNDAAEKRGL